MNRRAFIVGAAALLPAPLAAEAQQKAAIGVIDASAPPAAPRFYPSFWKRLNELGWREGENLTAATRGAGGDIERIEALAAELVRMNVNVIAMDSGTFARRVQENVTRTVPICVAGGDLQQTRAVTNLARPEGNITGVQVLQADLAGKRLALLKEIVPDLTRVGVLVQKRDAPVNIAVLRATDDAARRLGLQLYTLEAQHPDDVDRVFSILTNAGARGLVVVNNPSTIKNRQKIVALAAKARVVTIYEYRDWSEAGGLLAYGPVLSEVWRQLADCVDRILRGAKPADVPVQQPSKFELVINLKTAKALGLTMPPSLLLRADQMIE